MHHPWKRRPATRRETGRCRSGSVGRVNRSTMLLWWWFVVFAVGLATSHGASPSHYQFNGWGEQYPAPRVGVSKTGLGIVNQALSVHCTGVLWVDWNSFVQSSIKTNSQVAYVVLSCASMKTCRPMSERMTGIGNSCTDSCSSSPAFSWCLRAPPGNVLKPILRGFQQAKLPRNIRKRSGHRHPTELTFNVDFQWASSRKYWS